MSPKIERIETGDHWTAKESIELDLGLVDELSTSADYLLRANRTRDLVELSHKRKRFEDGLARLFFRVIERLGRG